MIDGIKWFEHMRADIDRAQKNFESGNDAGMHYFLGRLVGDVRVIRDLIDEKLRESAKSSKTD